MSTEDIDDLFRQELESHSTPPGEALWARLQADVAPTAADEAAERLDTLFQKGLNTYATAPGRELWERLEDEHLRPRKRRAAAWWPMAVAAAVALLLIAGGAGLWLSFPSATSRGDMAASHLPASKAVGTESIQHAPNNAGSAADGATRSTAVASAARGLPTVGMASAAFAQKNVTSQATRSGTLASSAPKAKTTVAEQLPRHLREANRQPDAATDQLPQVAQTTARPVTPKTLRRAADEPRPQPEIMARTIVPTPTPVAEPFPADVASAPSLASAGELITVDVRNGEASLTRSPRASIATGAVAEAQAERRPLGARLLRQAGHLVRGERLSLSEVTGLPENLTVRATIAGRSLTKSIQL